MVSKRMLIGPIVLFALVLVGYPGYWLYVGSFAKNQLKFWTYSLKTAGFTITHGTFKLSGFPFLVRIEITTPKLTNIKAGLSFYTRKINLELQPWNLRRFRIETLGTQELRFDSKISARNVAANTGDIKGVFVIGNSNQFSALSLDIQRMQLIDADQRTFLSIGEILADISKPDQPPIDHMRSSLKISFSANQIGLASLDVPTLGKVISNIKLKADFLGHLAGNSIMGSITNWRKSGGTLEVHWLNLLWGALDLRANGTIALDAKMRPLGALTADIRGYKDTLEALSEAKIIRSDVLPASRLTLDLLAKPSKVDGRRVLTVPVTAQEGGLYLGPLKLAKLPSLAIPGLDHSSSLED